MPECLECSAISDVGMMVEVGLIGYLCVACDDGGCEICGRDWVMKHEDGTVVCRQHMTSVWREWPDDSDCCGADVQVCTARREPGQVDDGDQAKCLACGGLGKVHVLDVDQVWIVWVGDDHT